VFSRNVGNPENSLQRRRGYQSRINGGMGWPVRGRRGATRESGMAQTKGFIKLIQSQSGSDLASAVSNSSPRGRVSVNAVVCWWAL
jgi:hypothetical protein